MNSKKSAKEKLRDFFDESLYAESAEAVNESNLTFYKLFNQIMIFLLALLYASTFFSDYGKSLMSVYVIFIAMSAAELIILHLGWEKMLKSSQLICYLGIFKAYTFCLFTSVIFNTNGPAITFYVFMILIPVAFLLKPRAMLIIQLLSISVFTITDLLMKSTEFSVGDVFSGFLFFVISLIIGTQISRLRIGNVHMAEMEKQQNIKLEANRTLMNAAVDNASMTVWEYSPAEKKIIPVYASKSEDKYFRVFDNVPEAVIGDGIVSPESAQSFRDIFEDAAKGKAMCESEIQLFTTGQSPSQWRLIRLVLSENASPGELRYIGSTMDISERKHTEQQFEEQLRVMDSVSDENLITKGRWNLSTNIQEWISTKRSTALPIEDAISYDKAMEELCLNVIPEEKKSELKALLNRATLIDEFRKGNDQYTVVYQRKTPGMDVLWISMQIRVCASPENNDVIAFAFSRDVTEEMLNRTIVDQLLTDEYDYFGTLTVRTGKYSIRSVKPGADRYYDILSNKGEQVDFDKSAYISVENSVVPEEKDGLRAKMTVAHIVKSLKKEPIYFISYSVMDESGETLRKQMRFCYLDGTKEIILFSRTDISRSYRMEQKQLQQVRSLLGEAKEANAAKSVFLSRMSHDMRTPMNGIIGMTRLAMDLPELPESVMTYLKGIDDSSRFLLSLINDTLDMSRIESSRVSLKPEVINSSELVSSILTTIKPLIEEKNIELEFVPINAAFGYVRVDGMRVHQVFMNIMSNAIKFTPQGGKIRLEVECLASTEKNTRISIEDDGIGMSEEFLSRVFEPFAQENANSPSGMVGTGLGMSIVKSLVELMGGSISIESKQGVGTKVTVFMNFEKISDYHEEESDVSAVSEEILKGKRVLLVEDHPMNALIAGKLLEKKEIVSELSVNGKEGLERFISSQPGYYDAVLMDIRMPVMNGIEAAKAIRALGRPDALSVPIIAMTANAYEEDVEESGKAGMNAHLAKPIEPELLYAELAKQISHREDKNDGRKK